MKKGLLLINSFNKTSSYMYQNYRYQEEAKKLGIELEIKRTIELNIFINEQGSIEGISKSDYDFIIYNDKDIYIAKMLEKIGFRLFNSSEAIENCDNKLLTNIILSNHNIKMPLTIPSHLCYSQKGEYDQSYLKFAKEQLGYPLVFKESYGSLGLHVYLIKDENELKEYISKYEYNSFLIQKFIKSSYGEDIRVIAIGGKAVAYMRRKNEHDFRSNIGHGGKGYKVEINKNIEDLAGFTAKILNLDYCGIDILKGEKEGEYYICEVNSNAFFEELERVTGVNIANLYLKYIYDIIYEGKSNERRD